MIHLSAKVSVHGDLGSRARGPVLRVSTDSASLPPDRERAAYLARGDSCPPGFAVYLLPRAGESLLQFVPTGAIAVLLPETLDHLEEGDVVRVSPLDQRLRVLYRKRSGHNHFLVTERCDHYCLMCSQPPRNVQDDWVIDEILETIPLMDPATAELGFTGGEPTLLGDRFLDLLRACKEQLPATSVHVLSNGRRFADPTFAKDWAEIQHPDLMVGIPIYSDVSSIHDYVVQADGAFDGTIRGILNLKRLRQKVEIRVVLHRQTFERLPKLAEFIARNLLFVDHVALMGLEIMGFARANLEQVWIDPAFYQRELYEAVNILATSGLRVSIYNLQLCLLDRRLWPYAVKSISDWKREYFPECESCAVKADCGGAFFSAKYRRSDFIRPVRQECEAAA